MLSAEADELVVVVVFLGFVDEEEASSVVSSLLVVLLDFADAVAEAPGFAWLPRPSMRKGMLYWNMRPSLASEITSPYVFSAPSEESTRHVNEPAPPFALPFQVAVTSVGKGHRQISGTVKEVYE